MYQIIKSPIQRRLLFFLLSLLLFLPAAIYVFSMTWIYSSEAKIKITNFQVSPQQSGLGGISGGSSVLSLISGDSNSSETSTLAKEIMDSRIFYMQLLADETYVKYIYDYKAYKDGTDIFFNKLNEDTLIKIRTTKVFNDSFREFKENFYFKKNLGDNFAVLRYSHPSPIGAQYILQLIIKTVNELVREIELSESQLVLDFIVKESVADRNLKNNLNIIALEHQKKILHSQISDEYIFQTIDPPNPPLYKSSPKRLQMLVLIMLASISISLLIILIDLKIGLKKIPSIITGSNKL
jgi:hypothetical protein